MRQRLLRPGIWHRHAGNSRRRSKTRRPRNHLRRFAGHRRHRRGYRQAHSTIGRESGRRSLRRRAHFSKWPRETPQLRRFLADPVRQIIPFAVVQVGFYVGFGSWWVWQLVGSAVRGFGSWVPHTAKFPCGGFIYIYTTARYFPLACLCRNASNKTTPAATDTLSDFTGPLVGSDTTKSHRLRVNSCKPLPSPPSTIPVGEV